MRTGATTGASIHMPNRRQFLTTTALLGTAAQSGLWSCALAQAQTQTGAPASAPAPGAVPDTPPGVNGSRGLPPGPWNVPADDPDPAQWRDLKIARAPPAV